MGRFAVEKLFDCLKVIKIGSEIGYRTYYNEVGRSERPAAHAY